MSTTTIRPTTRRLALLCAALLVCAWCVRPGGAQEAGARPNRAAGGAISGRVVGEGGEPLPHASVVVRPWGFFRTPRPARPFTSEEDGSFVAPGLDPGVYFVSAHRVGYVPDPEQFAATGHRPGDFVTVRMVRGGVVTGVVTDAGGTPLVALPVRLYRVRDQEGRPAPNTWGFVAGGQTDDRGVYRVYGLPPGTYVVSAGGGSFYSGWGFVSPYEGNVLTFYPAGTRDTATEIAVRAGQETAGIDIRYREERGRRVTGTLDPPPRAGQARELGWGSGVQITLVYAGTAMPAAHTSVDAGQPTLAFSFEGVADGEYDVRAETWERDGVHSTSAPQRVSVRGADVTGLRLTLAPLAGVSGSVSAEAAPETLRALADCKGRPATALPQETLVFIRRDAPRAKQPAQPQPLGPARLETSPDETGAFMFRSLEPGLYRFEARPLDEHFYVRSLQLPAAGAQANAGRGAPAYAVQLGSGQQLSGVSVRLAAGAAGASGSVSAGEGAPAFSLLRVYLLPAERERAEDLLRYAEATPTPAGAFTFKNLAPGRYLLVVRATDAAEANPRPPFWDADARARLRREAEAAPVALDLQPCQRATDLTLRYPQKP